MQAKNYDWILPERVTGAKQPHCSMICKERKTEQNFRLPSQTLFLKQFSVVQGDKKELPNILKIRISKNINYRAVFKLSWVLVTDHHRNRRRIALHRGTMSYRDLKTNCYPCKVNSSVLVCDLVMAENMIRLQEELNNIPLADEDAQDDSDVETEGTEDHQDLGHQSFESIPSAFTNGSNSPAPPLLDPDLSSDEMEEKTRLISQVLELQNTLEDLSQRVDSVKEENLKLKSENQVLGQYIENLMSASNVFQCTSPKSKKKGSFKGKK
ncbi:short coiled-coil protein B [Nephila pilipes]|uniref:Short coiled-coil protein B n=1 Tax=Nephila pilipes TaxID=299642 RepID=A0A8X6NBE8_NEPPI|nr:short coiled-coil protein B [Nephila pilipes]